MNRRIALILILLGLHLFNIPTLIKDLSDKLKKRKEYPFSFAGHQFMGLERVFEGHRYVGYYTDKNFNNPKDLAQYSQAQYMLAPTILDLNNLEHKYVIFDCTHPRVAIKKIKEIGAKAIKRSASGIILAQTKP